MLGEVGGEGGFVEFQRRELALVPVEQLTAKPVLGLSQANVSLIPDVLVPHVPHDLEPVKGQLPVEANHQQGVCLQVAVELQLG